MEIIYATKVEGKCEIVVDELNIVDNKLTKWYNGNKHSPCHACQCK